MINTINAIEIAQAQLTAAQSFNLVKDDMKREFKRIDKLVKTFCKSGHFDRLVDNLSTLDDKKKNTPICNMFFIFTKDDHSKISSCLRQIFTTSYFGSDCNNLTIPKFTSLLKKLLTTKDNKVSTIKGKLVHEDIAFRYTNGYGFKVTFDQELYKDIIALYL